MAENESSPTELLAAWLHSAEHDLDDIERCPVSSRGDITRADAGELLKKLGECDHRALFDALKLSDADISRELERRLTRRFMARPKG